MKFVQIAAVITTALALAGVASAQRAERTKKLKVLAIGEAKGFEHDATSYALATIWKIGQDSGLWDTYIRTDTELITKKKLSRNAKNLNYFDAVVFYTSGELDMDDQQKADLLSFIHDDGKGFIGIHSATDTFYKWPEYGEMIGGYFDGHPWGRFEAPIIVEDRKFPATRHFPKEFTIKDEIYQQKNFSRKRVRVLMRLDASKLDMSKKGIHRTDGDFAVSWARNYGKGRVFYTSFGHLTTALARPDVQKMFLEALKWSMGLTKGDATPRPRPE